MKIPIICLCFWSSAVVGFSPFRNVPEIFSRVVGGRPALKDEFPYQVSLQYYHNRRGQWRHFCGGSIVACDKVITAAHCVYRGISDNIRVVAGEYNLTKDDHTEQIVSILSATIHPKFYTETIDYDYAVLRLASPLKLNEHVKPIRLASADYEPCGHCLTTGWGNMNGTNPVFPDVLQVVSLPIVPHPTCVKIYENFVIKITDRMVCAGEDGKGSCHGDSGGPLICNGILVGITSWGNPPCAQKEYPTVYANIAAVRSWFDAQ